MIAADLARAMVMLAVPLAAVSGWLTLAGVFIALALISALSAIFEMADHAFLPSVIDASQLVDGNTKLGTTDAVAESVGRLWPASWSRSLLLRSRWGRRRPPTWLPPNA